MVKKIAFTIDANGEVKVDVQGAVGAECDALTEPFESRLGILGNKERKDSFYETGQSLEQDTTFGSEAK